MANAYVPPGVAINETVTPSITPLIGSPADICLIGLAGTYAAAVQPLTTTDTVIISSTAQVLPTLAALNSDATLLSITGVANVLQPSGIAYVVSSSSPTAADVYYTAGEGPPDGINGTVALGTSPPHLTSGTLIAITYTYLPTNYYSPIRLADAASIQARFGNAWQTGAINGTTYYLSVGSQLSLAAMIALQNGASSVICQPLFKLNASSNPVAPGTQTDGSAGNATQVATDVGAASTWTQTLAPLRAIEDINVIVPILGADGTNITNAGTLAVFQAVQAHQVYMDSLNQEIVAIFGADGTIQGTGSGLATGTSSTGLMAYLQNSMAPGLRSLYGTGPTGVASQGALINNTVFQLVTPNRPGPSGAFTTINVGGQYTAAAVAGQLAARPVSSSLTRKPLFGFAGITDPRTPADKNVDAGAGMMVVESVKGAIRVRHAITLDNATGPEFSELSVVRAKGLMIQSLRDTLDNQIIGNIIADANSPLVVRSAVSSVLGILVESKVIVGYNNIAAALTNLNPTTITITFTYDAAFTVNNIAVIFELDLTNNTVTVVDSGTSATSSGT